MAVLQSIVSSPPVVEERDATPFFAHVTPGRLVEIVSSPESAYLTAATAVVLGAQAAGELCVWIQRQDGRLFPPDFAASGVDLNSLTVVQIPKDQRAFALLKAAEQLLRSGSFGSLIIDVEKDPLRDGGAWQARLAALAREHRARVVLLSDRPAAADSLGPMISLRVFPRHTRVAPGIFRISFEVLRNKSGGRVTIADAVVRGPWGLS